ncbi:mucin-2-like [Ornithodoros turicata]|uniref:mucin-2-like n=1 Tax=Ornithodoros turicata TaxID=34597 RepID=UPI0031398B91
MPHTEEEEPSRDAMHVYHTGCSQERLSQSEVSVRGPAHYSVITFCSLFGIASVVLSLTVLTKLIVKAREDRLMVATATGAATSTSTPTSDPLDVNIRLFFSRQPKRTNGDEHATHHPHYKYSATEHALPNTVTRQELSQRTTAPIPVALSIPPAIRRSTASTTSPATIPTTAFPFLLPDLTRTTTTAPTVPTFHAPPTETGRITTLLPVWSPEPDDEDVVVMSIRRRRRTTKSRARAAVNIKGTTATTTRKTASPSTTTTETRSSSARSTTTVRAIPIPIALYIATTPTTPRPIPIPIALFVLTTTSTPRPLPIPIALFKVTTTTTTPRPLPIPIAMFRVTTTTTTTTPRPLPIPIALFRVTTTTTTTTPRPLPIPIALFRVTTTTTTTTPRPLPVPIALFKVTTTTTPRTISIPMVLFVVTTTTSPRPVPRPIPPAPTTFITSALPTTHSPRLEHTSTSTNRPNISAPLSTASMFPFWQPMDLPRVTTNSPELSTFRTTPTLPDILLADIFFATKTITPLAVSNYFTIHNIRRSTPIFVATDSGIRHSTMSTNLTTTMALSIASETASNPARSSTPTLLPLPFPLSLFVGTKSRTTSVPSTTTVAASTVPRLPYPISVFLATRRTITPSTATESTTTVLPLPLPISLLLATRTAPTVSSTLISTQPTTFPPGTAVTTATTPFITSAAPALPIYIFKVSKPSNNPTLPAPPTALYIPFHDWIFVANTRSPATSAATTAVDQPSTSSTEEVTNFPAFFPWIPDADHDAVVLTVHRKRSTDTTVPRTATTRIRAAPLKRRRKSRTTRSTTETPTEDDYTTVIGGVKPSWPEGIWD